MGRVYAWVRHELPVKYKQVLHIVRAFLHFLPTFARLMLLKRRLKGTPLVNINLIEHLGDIVANEPVSRFVREKYPLAFIVWTVKKPYVELLEHNPHVDSVLTVFCLTEWLLLRWSGIFEETVNLHFTDRSCPRCLLPVGRVGGKALTMDEYFRHGNLLTAFCISGGIAVPDAPSQVYIPASARENVVRLSLPASFIAIHTVTHERAKEWSAAKWKETIGTIVREWGMPVVEVGLEQPVHGASFSGYINLCGKLRILESAEVIRRARVFVGLDSGPAHLANAVGVYSVVLLGTWRDLPRYMPFNGRLQRGENAEIVHADGPLENIPVGTVLQAVKRGLDLSPRPPY